MSTSRQSTKSRVEKKQDRLDKIATYGGRTAAEFRKITKLSSEKFRAFVRLDRRMTTARTLFDKKAMSGSLDAKIDKARVSFKDTQGVKIEVDQDDVNTIRDLLGAEIRDLYHYLSYQRKRASAEQKAFLPKAVALSPAMVQWVNEENFGKDVSDFSADIAKYDQMKGAPARQQHALEMKAKYDSVSESRGFKPAVVERKTADGATIYILMQGSFARLFNLAFSVDKLKDPNAYPGENKVKITPAMKKAFRSQASARSYALTNGKWSTDGPATNDTLASIGTYYSNKPRKATSKPAVLTGDEMSRYMLGNIVSLNVVNVTNDEKVQSDLNAEMRPYDQRIANQQRYISIMVSELTNKKAKSASTKKAKSKKTKMQELVADVGKSARDAAVRSTRSAASSAR